jgi:hypothetical protein
MYIMQFLGKSQGFQHIVILLNCYIATQRHKQHLP